ncbi:MAG: hypothetical protein M4579_005043 [Chaenotheca gracillima]|nr:MAG: hypothetical protein M4579_005043 [Chaenotheca gracillima]
MTSASDPSAQVALQQVGKPLDLVPVGLKEAALDSPTFRATAVHFSDQVEVVERWLEGYVKSAGKLVHEVSSLEEAVNNFLSRSVPPANISEAVLDHDYTLLAMKKYGEGAREVWSHTISGVKKLETTVVDPIRAFLLGELRNFKDARRYLDQSQKNFDSVLSRYAAQSKTKEASSLREDAFQLFEARKSYTKASMDFCLLAPQVRSTIDKLLVRIFTDQWREMKKSRETLNGSFSKGTAEMERVRGWSIEMEAGERTFRRELQTARKIFEERASATSRPSRELDDYSVSTIPFLASKGPAAMTLQSPAGNGQERAEKQGWLFLRTFTGKPTRTLWLRRWFFVKNGIFGWLVQGARTGGVEESERTGVLLCNVKAASQEERRFCFEVKTKDNTVLIQAETQNELTEWIGAFEMAKRKALEDTTALGTQNPGSTDAAFAISPPSVPEFAAKMSETHGHHGSDDISGAGFERSSTLNIPEGGNGGSLASRSSFDVASTRKTGLSDKESEGGRDHAARIIQKLDLHRKSTAGAQLTGNSPSGPPTAGLPTSSSGIASLISASHNILPVYSAPVVGQSGTAASPNSLNSDVTIANITAASSQAAKETPYSSLAPSTLANPPAPTNLSKAAVIVSGERGIGMEQSDITGGIPSGLMANVWGSSNWGHINRLERGELRTTQESRKTSVRPMRSQSGSPPKLDPLQGDEKRRLSTTIEGTESAIADGSSVERVQSSPGPSRHRKTISMDTEGMRSLKPVRAFENYPPNYPIQLKTQEAQFRMLFPNVPREDKLLMVFRATWNPNDQQDFPGRVYVTANDIYFYSHHLGLVLISGVSLGSVEEVTAAPGKDCDFLFLHLREGSAEPGHSRITIKTFLDNLRLLQRRLNYLVQNFDSDEDQSLEEILNHLIKIEKQDFNRSPSLESWEDVSINTPEDSSSMGRRMLSARKDRDLRTSLRIDQGLYDDGGTSRDRGVTKFRLPAKPITYEPRGMTRKVVDKQFDVSPKALFHVMFGDKSAVFQILYRERRAHGVKQGPWYRLDEGHMKRDFEYQIAHSNWLGSKSDVAIQDNQTIDVFNDHLCYVVTDKKNPWHLPHREDFELITKIIITHVSKSKCRLAIYTHVQWTKPPNFLKGTIESQALADLHQDALDLSDVLADQVRKLGPQSRTKKAIQIFGLVGHSAQTPSLLPSGNSTPTPNSPGGDRPRAIKSHTVPSLVFTRVLSTAETAASETMSLIFAIVRTVYKICSAHGFILTLLLASALANLLLTSFHSTNWWHERRASRFMAKLGVGPDTVMSKAIYLRDLEDPSFLDPYHSQAGGSHTFSAPDVNTTTNDPPPPYESTNTNSRKCYTTFLELTHSPPHSTSPSSPPSHQATTLTSRTTALRLARTRSNLALYRHDLLVAMRVVNDIERSVLRAEWADWVGTEVRRCERVGERLGLVGDDDNPDKNVEGDSDDGERKERLKTWYREYCESCRRESEGLLG